MTDGRCPRISVMKPLHLLCSLGLAVGVAACGGSAPDASSSGAGAPGATGSAASGPASSSAVVPHEKLAALLPNIPGFTTDAAPRGETHPEDMISRVTASYVAEDRSGASLGIEMMDVSTNAMMLTAFKAIQQNPGTHKTITGTQKTLTIGGYPAYEEWTPEAGNGTVSVLVAERFLIAVTGESVGKVEVIHKAIDAIDLKKIAALK